MSGNEFLKTPPHKNVGGLPFGEYVRMRFQMGASKLPYLKREMPDGILEVQRIYKEHYRVLWTPSGGVEISYVIRYTYNDEGRVKFLNSKMAEVGDFPRVAFPAATEPGAGFLGLQSWEWKFGDLIGCLFNTIKTTDYIFNVMTVKVYSPLIGDLLDFGYSYNKVVQSGNVDINGLTSYGQLITLAVKDGKLLFSSRGSGSINVLTPSKTDDGYELTLDTVAPASAPYPVINLDTTGIWYEDGVWFYQVFTYPGGLIELDPFTGAMTPQPDISNPSEYYWKHQYTSLCYRETFGDSFDDNPPFSQWWQIPGAGYVLSSIPPYVNRPFFHSTISGKVIYELSKSLSVLPYTVTDASVYLYDGTKLFTEISQDVLNSFCTRTNLDPRSINYERGVRNPISWNGFDKNKLEYYDLYGNASGNPLHTIIYGKEWYWNNVKKTEAEFKRLFSLPEDLDTRHIQAVNYLPGLGNNQLVAGIVTRALK